MALFVKIALKLIEILLIKKLVLKKYGVENMFQLDNIKEKIIETNLTKYGVINPNIFK